MHKGNDKLSVLMSTYYKDDPDLLYKALLSLSEQTLKANEVVLVEDGPLPLSLVDVINQFRPTLNIKSVKLAKNMGLGSALAAGLDQCSAPLIARMDTDDISVPERFRKQYDFLTKNPEIAIVGGHISEFNDDPDKPQYNRMTKLTHKEIVKSSWLRNPFNHMTVMFRKEAILRAGNYQHVPSFEDYDLWLRVISAGYQCHNLNEILVYAHTGNDLISRRSGLRYISSECKAIVGFRKYKVIPPAMLVVNLTIRLLIRISPKQIIKLLYRTTRKQCKHSNQT